MKQYQDPPGFGKRKKNRELRRERKAQVLSAQRLLEPYLREAAECMRPLVGELLATAAALLQQRQQADGNAPTLRQDVDSVAALQPYLHTLERRFETAFLAAAQRDADPGADSDPPQVRSIDSAPSTLDSQTVDILARRFADPLKMLDVRLGSLYDAAGIKSSPQPFHPRVWVEAVLETFPTAECSAALRATLLRLFEALALDHLPQTYALLNSQLARAGHGLSTNTSARAAKTAPQVEPVRRYSVRGEALRQYVRKARSIGNENSPRREMLRELTPEEFCALLYLLQSSPRALSASAGPETPFGTRLREAIWFTASRLGIDAGQTRFDADQADAIDLTTRVFERLLGDDALSPVPRARIEQLALPYLRLVLRDPYLLDPPEHPFHALLAVLLRILEGNPGISIDDQRLHLLADDAVRAVVDDEYADFDSIQTVLNTLRQELTRHFEQAQATEKSARNTVETRERLQLSRHAADMQLTSLMRDKLLLPGVAAFLSDQWRQSLIRTWLRDGAESREFAEAAALGHTLVAIDQASAQARGRSVANELLRIEPQLRDCCQACGLDAEDTERVVSSVVAELATPDGRRAAHEFMPLALPIEPGEPVLPVGTELLLREPDGSGQRLRVAWHSPNSGTELLVDRHGYRQAVLSASEIKQLLADRRIQLRPPEGPVEALLTELARAAQADAGVRDPIASTAFPHEVGNEHTDSNRA